MDEGFTPFKLILSTTTAVIDRLPYTGVSFFTHPVKTKTAQMLIKTNTFFIGFLLLFLIISASLQI